MGYRVSRCLTLALVEFFDEIHRMQGRKQQFQRGAGPRNVVNPFDLVDADPEEILVEEDLSAELIVTLRKAYKRNPISRLKALEELKAYVESEENIKDIKSAAFAKHLMRLFTKISVDPERRVRESAFSLLWLLCRSAETRRCFNFIITELAFYWIGAFFDPVGSIANLAQKSFTACFVSEEKVALFVDLVKQSTRKLIKETLEFRAEDARKAALSDPEFAETAQVLFALHMVRAISAEAFLAQRLGFEEEICRSTMHMLEIHGSSTPIINCSLYQYALAVNIPPIHMDTIYDIAISDITNAEIVLQLFYLERYRSVSLDPSQLAEYFRQCISNHPKSIIRRLKSVFMLQNPHCQSLIISRCLSPNTLDTPKLISLIENFFSQASAQDSCNIFEAIIEKREPPWTNLDVITALDSMSRAFGEEFVNSRLQRMDCTNSVPLLVVCFRRGLVDIGFVCSSLQQLRLSTKDLSLILSEEKLANDGSIIRVLFEPFKTAVGKGQLLGFIRYFDIRQLLQQCDEKGHVLTFIAQHGTQDSPWKLALEFASNSDVLGQIMAKMLSVAKFSNDLLDQLKDYQGPFGTLPINSTWLESERFASFLIEHGHSSLVLGHVVKELPLDKQLTFLHESQDLSSFIDFEEFLFFCQSICRSKVGWKRCFYLDLLDENFPPLIEAPVLKILLDKNVLSKAFFPHLVVYCMWIDDKLGLTHKKYYQSILSQIDEPIAESLSSENGGYYSHIYELVAKCKNFVSSFRTRDDHSIAQCRISIENLDLENCSDLTLRMVIMIPVMSRIPNLIVSTTMKDSFAEDPVLVAAFLAAVENNELIEECREQITNFINQNGLLATDFLIRHPQFMSDKLQSDLIDQFQRNECNKSHCLLTRQIAPFHLESFSLVDILPLVHDPTKSRTVRFIFNILHDKVIQKLQFLLQTSSDRESSLFATIPSQFFRPTSIDSFELLIGLAEASKEIPLVLSTIIQSVVLSEELVLIILDTLGWTTSSPIDLAKVEFTNLDWDEEETEEHVLAANILFRAFRIFPQILRKAFDSRHKSIEKFMREYMSPIIIRRELDKCRRYMKSLSPQDILKVKVLSSSTQSVVQAEYCFEDTRLALHLDIPASFPLSPLTVDSSSGRKGVSEAKWKAALLSATPILTSAVSIMEGLRAWGANLDKQLAGIEPCAICYCVLHPSDRTLPTPQCRTCSHRFHSACLYKWFRTGGQATCPLCRSLF